jgi:hypothetical protein
MRSNLLRLAILLIVSARPLAAQSASLKTHVFGGHEWTMRIPSEYVDERKATPDEMTEIVVFRPNARPDGTRPMLHILTMEISTIPGAMGSPDFFDVFVKRVIGEIEKRHDHWKVDRTDVTVNGRKMARFAWSGTPLPVAGAAASAAPVAARGVMLFGEDGHVAFMLHSQDAAKYANQTVVAGEQAIRTFALRDKH